ncbi:hypothetical protein TWF481_001446 [Arthrobotrys musiformis]|uniref:Uncharacterized protein n=1 Tax=Arthrobotrys musiformis TaxID=47236 RepID=A0AAV9WQV1_9PEZI
MGHSQSKYWTHPLVYKEPTYKERRENWLPNWFWISDTIGQPYRFRTLRFYFDRSDPGSLVKQLRKHWMAGIIVWKCPISALKSKDRNTRLSELTGKMYLIDWDDMPNEIVNEGVWCGAIYPTWAGEWARLYVGCPELWEYHPQHPTFWPDTYTPGIREERRLRALQMANSYWESRRVSEWLAATEDGGSEIGTQPQDPYDLPPSYEEATSEYNGENPYERESYTTYATLPPDSGAREDEEGSYITELATWNLEYKFIPYHKWPQEVFAQELTDKLRDAIAKSRNEGPYSTPRSSTSSVDIYTEDTRGPPDQKDGYTTPAHSIYIPVVKGRVEISDGSYEILDNLSKIEKDFGNPAERVLQYRLTELYSKTAFPDWEEEPEWLSCSVSSPNSESSDSSSLHCFGESKNDYPPPYPSSPSPSISSSSSSSDSNPSYSPTNPLRPKVAFVVEEKPPREDDHPANRVTEEDIIPTSREGFYCYVPNIDWVHAEYRHLVQTGNLPKENYEEAIDRGTRGFICIFSRHVDACEFVPPPPLVDSQRRLLRYMKYSIDNNPWEGEDTNHFFEHMHAAREFEFSDGDSMSPQLLDSDTESEYCSDTETSPKTKCRKPKFNEDDFRPVGPEEFLIPELSPYIIEKRTAMQRYVDSMVDDWKFRGYYDYWGKKGRRVKGHFLCVPLGIYHTIGVNHAYESPEWRVDTTRRYFSRLMQLAWPLPSEREIKFLKGYAPLGRTVCTDVWSDSDDEDDEEEDDEEDEDEDENENEEKEGEGEEDMDNEDEGGNLKRKFQVFRKWYSKKYQNKCKESDRQGEEEGRDQDEGQREKEQEEIMENKGEFEEPESEDLVEGGEEEQKIKDRFDFREIDVWARVPPLQGTDEEAEKLMLEAEVAILKKYRRDAEPGSRKHWKWWYMRDRVRFAMRKEWLQMIDRFWQARAEQEAESSRVEELEGDESDFYDDSEDSDSPFPSRDRLPDEDMVTHPGTPPPEREGPHLRWELYDYQIDREYNEGYREDKNASERPKGEQTETKQPGLLWSKYEYSIDGGYNYRHKRSTSSFSQAHLEESGSEAYEYSSDDSEEYEDEDEDVSEYDEDERDSEDDSGYDAEDSSEDDSAYDDDDYGPDGDYESNPEDHFDPSDWNQYPIHYGEIDNEYVPMEERPKRDKKSSEDGPEGFEEEGSQEEKEEDSSEKDYSRRVHCPERYYPGELDYEEPYYPYVYCEGFNRETEEGERSDESDSESDGSKDEEAEESEDDADDEESEDEESGDDFENIRYFPVWRQKVFNGFPYRTYTRRPPPRFVSQSKHWDWLCHL